MDTDSVNKRSTFETAILAAMEKAAETPMCWGVDDCALWVASIEREILGYDPAKSYRGRYTTRRGALRAMRGNLLKQIREVARRRKWKRIDPRLAQTGDVGMAWTEYSGKAVLATVICRKKGWFVGRNERGVTILPADRVEVAWSVLDDALADASAFHLPQIGIRRPMLPTESVVRDPISLIVLTAVGIEATATAVVITTFLITTAASLAVSYGVSLLMPQKGGSIDNSSGGTSDISPIQGAQITERQAVPYKRVIVGRAYVGGALFYESVTPPYLTMGVLVNYGKIDGFDRIFIGSNEIKFTQLVENKVLTPLAVDGQANYPGRLQVSLRYGDADQSADLLVLNSLNNGTIVAVPGSTGTPIGTMTAQAGLSAAFDGNLQKNASGCATALSNIGYVGKDWGSGNSKKISYFVVTAPLDSNPLRTDGAAIALEGSNDNFATTATLYSSAFRLFDLGQSIAIQIGIDTSTAYRYHRVRLQTTALSISVAQVAFYELTASSILDANFAAFRQRGIATATYRYDFGADQNEFLQLWGQVARPNAYTVVRGALVYDPRDPTQDMNDESTWKWSNNATLIQTWYLTRDFGGRISMSRIRWDKIVESANYDDDLIGCLDGTMIARHTIDGVIMLNQQPFQVLQDLLTANRASVLESGGMVWIESSKPKTPIATIHDRMLIGGITYQNSKQKSDKVNKLQVRFVAPDADYQIVDGPILDRTDLQTIDGEVLPATLALNFTQDYRRAERLQKAFLLSSRLGGTIMCTVDLRLMATAAQNEQEELIGNVVSVESQLFPKMNGDYLVTSVGFADDCTALSLSLAKYDPTIESDWNPETDETPFTLAQLS